MSMLHRNTGGYVPRHQKTYLSREMTRAMSIDHPIGDPHGGPAYGERNDPISAIISIGTLFATGGAVIAGTATLMQGLMFAGAALSLVGNVSGNKTLSKIGMVVGLAGGVGALAESAGLFSSGTLGETFGYGEAAKAVGGAPVQPSSGGVPADVSNAIVEAPSPVNAAPNVVPDAAPSALVNNPAAAELATNSALNSAAPAPSSANLSSSPVGSEGLINNAAGPGVTGAPAAPSAATVNAPTVPSTADMLKVANASTDPIGSLAQQLGQPIDPSYAPNIRPMTGMESAWKGMKEIGSEFMNLAKSNSGAAYMLGQGISSLGDVLSGKADAQINALEAQGELSKAQAEKLRFEMAEYKRKQGLLNTNYANVRTPLATWNPNIQTTPKPGLIGNAMQPATGG